MSTTPKIIDVVVEHDTDDHHTGYTDLWSVDPVWSDVDRPRTGGWLVRGEKMARRLERALRAGAVYDSPRIATDVNGKTYVEGSAKVMGRYMNADLRRLGF